MPDFILNCLCYEISLWGENPPRSNETVKLVDVSKIYIVAGPDIISQFSELISCFFLNSGEKFQSLK